MNVRLAGFGRQRLVEKGRLVHQGRFGRGQRVACGWVRRPGRIDGRLVGFRRAGIGADDGDVGREAQVGDEVARHGIEGRGCRSAPARRRSVVVVRRRWRLVAVIGWPVTKRVTGPGQPQRRNAT